MNTDGSPGAKYSPDEVAEAMAEFDRKEAAYRLRTYRHKAYYSLDREDGIEHSALFVALSLILSRLVDTFSSRIL